MVLKELKNIPSISLLLDEQFCVSITDRNGKLIYVNNNFCKLTQYNQHELIGNSYELINKEFTAQTFVEEIKREVQENKVWQQDINGIAKDGTPFWIHATIVPVYEDDGSISHFISIDIDITQRKLINLKYEEAIENLHNIENALDQSSVVAITDQNGIITFVNEKFCELSKYTADELIGKKHNIVNSNYHPKSFFKDMWRTIGSGKIWRGDVRNIAKDGTIYWVNTTIVPFLNKAGKPYQYISIRFDITDRKEAEESLEVILKDDFRQTVKNLQNAIFKYSLDENHALKFTLIEGKIAEDLGITADRVNSGRINYSLLKGSISNVKRHFLRSALGKTVQFEVEYAQYTMLFYLSPIKENNRVIEVVGTAIDITERKNAEKTIEHMAYYDHLTGLANRRLLQKKFLESIELAKQKKDTFAFMFIDLDRFKNINDSMGHFIGDQLLINVGERLTSCVQKNDIVARLSGDEFVILFSPSEAVEVEKAAIRIVDEISQVYSINGLEVFIVPSIGISMYPKDGEDYDTLIRNADAAMYLAKSQGKNTYQFFTKELHNDMIEKTLLEMELRQALKNNQISLHYQPQYDITSGKLKGLEALARWQHPTLGNVSPAQFIPIAEETGLILPIGQWVLETACKQAKEWQRIGLPTLRMSVNVSIRQFKQPSFVAQVKNTLSETGLLPEYLNLEITESMTSDVQHCQMILHQFRAAGISVSIDDFGTGYSSLSYLSKFPINHLKIDQAFVRELNVNNIVIVKTIIDLAKNLNMHVIAEGVETKEQAQFLQNLHCDEVQGYLYSKPLPHDEIELLLTNSII